MKYELQKLAPRSYFSPISQDVVNEVIVLTWVTVFIGEPVNVIYIFFYLLSHRISVTNVATNNPSGRVSSNIQSSTSARSVCSIVRLTCLVRRDSEAEVSFENAPFFRPYIRFSVSIAVGKCVSRERHTEIVLHTSM